MAQEPIIKNEDMNWQLPRGKRGSMLCGWSWLVDEMRGEAQERVRCRSRDVPTYRYVTGFELIVVSNLEEDMDIYCDKFLRIKPPNKCCPPSLLP